jgi:hypothetical protein
MKQTVEFKPTDRFLSINVYKFPLGNCGGITDTLGKESIFIPCPDGPFTFGELENRKDLIFIPEQRGADYWALKPLMQPSGLIGPMAGGNLAYSSDSRCKHVYHIHDRFETQACYDSNF